MNRDIKYVSEYHGFPYNWVRDDDVSAMLRIPCLLCSEVVLPLEFYASVVDFSSVTGMHRMPRMRYYNG
jgi:hypothetical protein